MFFYWISIVFLLFFKTQWIIILFKIIFLLVIIFSLSYFHYVAHLCVFWCFFLILVIVFLKKVIKRSLHFIAFFTMWLKICKGIKFLMIIFNIFKRICFILDQRRRSLWMKTFYWLIYFCFKFFQKNLKIQRKLIFLL